MQKRIVGAIAQAVAIGSLVAASQFAGAQTAVLGANSAGTAYVFPNVNYPAGSCPATILANVVSGMVGSAPHGVGFYGSDFALISSIGQSRIDNVQLSTAASLNTLNTTALGYNGAGTIAIAPSLTHAIAGNGTTAFVLAAPFTAVNGTTTALPGLVATYQTQAIVFNSASRAFIAHSAGISVLDPPYTSVAFTIPGNHEAIAITPDGNTLLATDLSTTVTIYTGPFSAATTGVVLTIAGALGLDGLYSTPDGSRVLVVTASGPVNVLYSIAAPYSASSVVDTIPLPAVAGTFEDVSISADGLFALLTGNGDGDPPIAVRAPFTTVGATPCAISNVPSRSNGAVRFLPTGLQPPPGPTGPAVVPTLSEYALVALAALAAASAMLALRRRRQTR